MEEQVVGISYRVDGKRINTCEFEQKIIGECAAGATTSEVSRKYGIPVQNVVKWRRAAIEVREPEIARTVLLKDHHEAIDEIKRLQLEIKKLSRSLSKMTVDRDILKDAVDIASKKKWI